MEYLLQNNMISPTQYAFRPNSNTTLALQAVVNDLYRNKKGKKPVLAIYVDLSKAYDTVSHAKLIQKLENEFNFSPEAAKFFKSYFHNRQQETHTQHAKSSKRTITHGIPQGSTLSTTLFLLYINNIIQKVPKSKVYTYADDTTLIITAENVQDLQNLAQTELNNLINYFHNNNLVPNAKKTTYTLFHATRAVEPDQPLQLTVTDKLHSATLGHTETAKLLGIYIQHNLKYDATVNNIVSKLQRTVQILRYATTLLPTPYMVKLYYTHVFPHLIGAISIWGSQDNAKRYLQPLIRTHKKIIRIVCNVRPRTHTAPIMNKLGILNLTNLYTLRVCAEMHPFVHPDNTKIINRPQNDHQYIAVTDVHAHGTRFAKRGQIFSPNNYKYLKTRQPRHTSAHLAEQHSTVWNSLSEHLRNTTSLHVFKKELKLALLKEQIHKFNTSMTHGHHLS